MTRTVIVIPIMYSREELKKSLGMVPEDFEEVSSEFWSYVEGKLKPFIGRIYAVYSEKAASTKETGSRLDAVLKRFEGHAEFHCVEDPLLAAEAEAWVELMKNERNQAIQDLLEENRRDRDAHAIGILERTLEDGKIGVLFIDPARKLSFSEAFKVIRMCPFDPVDYLNRYLAKLRIEEKRK